MLAFPYGLFRVDFGVVTGFDLRMMSSLVMAVSPRYNIPNHLFWLVLNNPRVR
jgi:hypothetical protein